MGLSGNLRIVDPESPDPEIVLEAAGLLSRGGVIVFPTSGLYGLGVDPWKPEAVQRIFTLKGRPEDKPILLLIHSIKDLEGLVTRVPDMASALMEAFWPGRITLVMHAAASISPLITAGTGKIGIRLVRHPVARALIKALGHPVTGTSANLAGRPGCRDVKALDAAVTACVDVILDAGVLRQNLPSTVVDVTGPMARVLRQGAAASADVMRITARFSRQSY